MPLYRCDVETDQGTVHQYLFESDEDVSSEMRQHPRFGWPSLVLRQDHRLVTLPLHGEGASHLAEDAAPIAELAACRCSVLTTTTPRGPGVPTRDVLGSPAPMHVYKHAHTLQQFIEHVEADGRRVINVELHALPEPPAQRVSWLTS